MNIMPFIKAKNTKIQIKTDMASPVYRFDPRALPKDRRYGSVYFSYFLKPKKSEEKK